MSTTRTGQWHWFEPIYRFNIALLCCPAEQAKDRVRRVLPKDICDDLQGPLTNLRCDGRMLGSKHESTGIVVTFWFSPSADVAVIAHEVLHASYWVLKEKGLRLDDSSEAAYAY